MKDIEWKEVVFVENGDLKHGHFFFNITLPEALKKMAEKGLPDPVKNAKVSIQVYPW